MAASQALLAHQSSEPSGAQTTALAAGRAGDGSRGRLRETG
ncbi:hypothetical protein [Vandammella animalimorsus]|nr:hypothetical protein [Vandammella animalimorsus]